MSNVMYTEIWTDMSVDETETLRFRERYQSTARIVRARDIAEAIVGTEAEVGVIHAGCLPSHILKSQCGSIDPATGLMMPTLVDAVPILLAPIHLNLCMRSSPEVPQPQSTSTTTPIKPPKIRRVAAMPPQPTRTTRRRDRERSITPTTTCLMYHGTAQAAQIP